jgi:protoheme IX farnesyltransferase
MLVYKNSKFLSRTFRL